ncbi:hypothetical protein [Microbulbifer taiwanensis]
MYDPAHGNVEQLQRLLLHIEQKRAQLEQQLRDIQSLMGELDEAEARARASLKQNSEN